MDHLCQHTNRYSRREFLSKTGLGLGGLALSSLIGPLDLQASSMEALNDPLGTHFSPKVKRVIYLFQSGGPSQLELFDYKPELIKRNGEQLPDSVRQGQRLTGMTAGQKSIPMVGSVYDFQQHGASGAWVSELLPHIAGITDDICMIKSMFTEAINHDPAITFFQTGSQQPGRPSIGSWVSYGLGSENENLPAFCVLLSQGKQGAQPVYSRLWGNGFLPSLHQGVQFRSGKDPVLYLNDPPGISGTGRRNFLDHLQRLYELESSQSGDAEIDAKIAQYEMAYRMQTSVPETMDISNEPAYITDMYGPEVLQPGTYAANCLLARKLSENDVKFIQLYHKGWDQHGNLPNDIKKMAQSMDRPTAALIRDLKQRGMLEDTLVIWGGEFGRTSYSQGRLSADNYGRDHHPNCFTMWMAGAGVKKGISYGETDELGYNVVRDPVHVHDFQATLLHLLGVDHEKLTFKHQGRRYRLTDVHGKLVKGILS
ncbi:Protein of unknown function [Cyclobacterium lianum]|uniref:Tat (Twin-arginine translocation) pathway signal sequence n=1 Tax=Cyclobacterium lianum TaxID=388280 RepID=A0A1M7MQ35_9BACT|nr:DUF1501 domain-containing protein [Cyclobacterium lianum]SHM93050.1 Protein of unknown function [Cyclobacterium lianum]